MSTSRAAGPPADVDADAVAAALSEAPFVRVSTRADGDALAAGGVLARALRSAGVPFQVRTALSPSTPTGEGTTVTVAADGGDVALRTRPVSATAHAVAAALDGGSDPVLALAGAVAAGSVPGSDGTEAALERAEATGEVRRRPGVAVPTADLVDGLAHSTLLCAPFSGDPERARSALSGLGLDVASGGDAAAGAGASQTTDLSEDAHRRAASAVAIDVSTAPGASPRAAESVAAALRPYELRERPFATLGGYADVLDVVARERPGTGVALALGHDAREAALTAWRTHAGAAHVALRAATTARFDGVFVARVDDLSAPGRLVTAARLCREFRSPEPVALVVGDGVAAAASVEECALGSVAGEAAASVDGDAWDGFGDARSAVLRRDGAGDADTNAADETAETDAQAIEDAFREALR